VKGRAARRLSQLAQPLDPQREPYYVRRPVPPGLERTFPAEGWYWIPSGHNYAVFLGASEVTAALELHRLIATELADPQEV
jgi:hypothetical protein